MSDPFSEIKAWLAGSYKPACIAIFSADHTRRNRASKYLLEEISKAQKTRCDAIDCSILTLDKLRSLEANFKTLSLFSEFKILHLQHLSQIKKELLPFVSILINNANQQNLILITDSPLSKKVAAHSLITKEIQVVSFPTLEDQSLIEWVQREVKRIKLSPLPQSIVQDLIHSTDSNIDEIASRLEKLSLFADTSDITQEMYLQIFPSKLFGNDYKMVETIFNGDRKQTEYLASLSLQEGAQPLGLLSLINKTASQVIQLKFASGANAPMQIQPWLLQKYKKMASALPTPHACRAFIALASADFRLKDRNLGSKHVFSKIAQLFGR